jgi:hypothetical protein
MSHGCHRRRFRHSSSMIEVSPLGRGPNLDRIDHQDRRSEEPAHRSVVAITEKLKQIQAVTTQSALYQFPRQSEDERPVWRGDRS